MGITIQNLSKTLNIDEEIIKKIAFNMGIKEEIIDENKVVLLFDNLIKDKQNLYTNDQHQKHIQLNGFLEKIIKEKKEFEDYKKIEEKKLKDKFAQDELDHKIKLEELRNQTIGKQKEEFLENIKKEHIKINSKVNESIQRELKLNELEQEVDNLKKVLTQDKELFESKKEKLLSEYKQDLEKQKEIFNNQLEGERVKKLEKINEIIDELYKAKEETLEKKEQGLVEKETKLNNELSKFKETKDNLEQQEVLFESQKSKLLNEHKQKLEIDKQIFKNNLEEEKSKKLEETNKKIEELYKTRIETLEDEEQKLIKDKIKITELKTKNELKEKKLEFQSDLIYKQEKEKVSLKIKNFEKQLENFENLNYSLIEENSDLKGELDSYERYKNRNLSKELEEKQKEISSLKKYLDETTKIKNEIKIELDKTNRENEEKRKELYLENESLKKSIEDTERFRSESEILNEKFISANNHIEFLKGENKNLDERLKSIYSDGTEIEERIKDIKEKPYKKIELNSKSQINITNEIKYLDSIQENMKKFGIEYPKRLLYAFHTALKSSEFSPLSVLSGVSGTGKSELPKLYSYFGGFNFLAEAVQPTWDSPASMIGYYNTIDRKFDSTNILKFLLQTSQSKEVSPFGLKESMNMILLDEMNLAHIELYFAEFLSKFELRRGSKDVNLDIQLGTALNYPLPLDRNMLWIGTMNEDETTKSLSDKVLDRAFSINFPRPTELKSRAKLKTLDEIKTFEYLHRDTWEKWIQKKSLFTEEKSELLQKYKDITNQINQKLAPTGRAIGHRVWQSMEYYINNHPLIIKNIDDEDELKKHLAMAFEEQLVQKIMPKLKGIEIHGKEKEALMDIKEILIQNDFSIKDDFELSMENPYGQFIWNSANYLKED